MAPDLSCSTQWYIFMRKPCLLCGALCRHTLCDWHSCFWVMRPVMWLGGIEFNNQQPCNLCSISASFSTFCAAGYMSESRRWACWFPDIPHTHGVLLCNACAHMVNIELLLPFFFPLSTSKRALIAYGANVMAGSLLCYWHDDTSIICRRSDKHMVDASWCRKPNLV